jgi:hypothetical protein
MIVYLDMTQLRIIGLVPFARPEELHCVITSKQAPDVPIRHMCTANINVIRV